MQIILQLAFALLFGFGIFLFGRNIRRIRRNILLGKDFNSQKDRSEAIRDVLLLAFGQKKMFKKPLVALLHLVVYVGFIIVNIELLEIILDGLLGTHRIFAPSLGNLYTYLINC